MKNFIIISLMAFSFTTLAAGPELCESKPGDRLSEVEDFLNNLRKEEGFEECDLSYRYSTPDLGQLGLCQNQNDESKFRVIGKRGDQVQRTCIIPTYKDSTGAQTYLGEPECAFLESGVQIEGQLYKTRRKFTHLPINGVMVMKENLLRDYFSCMDAYENYLQHQCGELKDRTCVEGARNYQKSSCDAFKLSHQSKYLDLRLK